MQYGDPMLSARMKESIINDCIIRAASGENVELDNVTANVLGLSAVLLKREFPVHAENMLSACERYFTNTKDERLTAKQVLAKNWIISLPRLKDMIAAQLAHGGAK
jgi:hypothetical protein